MNNLYNIPQKLQLYIAKYIVHWKSQKNSEKIEEIKIKI
jgi:hypothetical protein